MDKSHLSAVVYQIWQISGMLHTEWNDISLIRRKEQQLPWTTFCGTWRRDHLRHLSIRLRSFFQYHICQIFSSYKIFVNSIRTFVEQELIKSLSNLTSEDLGIEDLNLALNLSTRSLIVHHIKKKWKGVVKCDCQSTWQANVIICNSQVCGNWQGLGAGENWIKRKA